MSCRLVPPAPCRPVACPPAMLFTVLVIAALTLVVAWDTEASR